MDRRRRALLNAAIFAATALWAGGATAQTCTEEAGAEDAKIYVEQCLEVSPATRPPCNAENACQMIWDEISRGCEMLGADAPAFCEDY